MGSLAVRTGSFLSQRGLWGFLCPPLPEGGHTEAGFPVPAPPSAASEWALAGGGGARRH